MLGLVAAWGTEAAPCSASAADDPPPADRALGTAVEETTTVNVHSPPSTEPDGAPAPSDRSQAPSSSDASAEAREHYDFAPGEICPFCVVTPGPSALETGLHWHHHWRSVGVPEYMLTTFFAAYGVGIEFFAPRAEEPSWTGPILFDEAVRDLLRLESPSARSTVRTVSDGLVAIAVVQPVVLDSLIVTWGIHDAPHVAWQLFVIDAQAFSFTFAVTSLTKRLVSRERPWVEPCRNDPTGASCGSGKPYESFFSGHAAITATGAGLICAHHTQLSLYRSKLLDTGACALAIAGTAVTGAMRIASDVHWATDVLMGHLTGYVSGYLLPTLLYYKQFRLTPHEHQPDSNGPSFAVLPIVGKDSLQLSGFGSW